MARKFYDLAAKGAEYQDRDGKTKHRYQPCGKLAVEDDGRMWIILEFLGMERMISVFEQKPRDGSPNSNGGSTSVGSRSPDSGRGSGGGGQGAGRNNDLEDDIPF